MPKKVSQLEVENRASLTNAYRVIVTDPTNYTLYQVPVTQFRGASVFVSENAPTNTPEDDTITEYIRGDIFIQETGKGKELFTWNIANQTWDAGTKLNGLRVLAATDFPDEVNLDLRETNFIDPSIYENDYYLNKTLNILYGAYSPTLGFKFGENALNGYIGFRSPIGHTLQGDDARGYENFIVYFQDYINDTVNNSLKDRLIMRRPIHRDWYHLLLENDEGHGGFYWYYDGSTNTTGTSEVVALTARTGGDTKAKRIHFREPKIWNTTTTPVQNDKKYRDGDSVLVLDQGVLYYNYKEGLPAGTTDLAVLFEGVTVLKGSSILNAFNETTGLWEAPVKDNKYAKGDFILTNEGGTPRIHGAYDPSGATDLDAWPLFSVLRSDIEHTFAHDDTLPTSFVTDYPTHNGKMIVTGDKLRVVYTDGVKEKVSISGVVVDLAAKTITWPTDLKNEHATQIHISAAVGIPSRDDLVYYEGDIIRNAVGDLFKYKEGQATDADAFEALPNLRANVIHLQQVSGGATTGDIVPDTANGSADWGGSTVQDNDTLHIEFVGSSTNKVLVFNAEVNEVANTINWKQRRSLHGNRSFTNTGAYIHPPNVNNSLYSDGDRIENLFQAEYVYDEDVANNGANPSWTFLSFKRPPVHLTVETDTPNTAISLNANGYSFMVEGTNYLTQAGDTVDVVYTKAGVKTGKVVRHVFQTNLDNTQSVSYNPNPVKIWTEASATRPNADDLVYSEGDFLDNPQTGWRYGAYVEGAPDNNTAWPDFIELNATTTYSDSTLGKDWKIRVDDDEFYFEEI